MASSRKTNGFLLAAASLGFGVVQLDVSVVNVAIKSIGATLGGEIALLQWIVSAYTLAFATLILGAGALGDRLGAKRVFIVGFALFTLASLACGLAPNVGLLIGARALQGVGAAMLVPCSLTLISHAYTEAHARMRAIGLWAAGASAALAAGPLVGGLLIAAFNWRAIFFINVPIGFLGMWLAIRFARETPQARERGFDLLGQVAAVAAFFLLTWALIEGGPKGRFNPMVVTSYVLAAIAAVLFVLVESKKAQPMIYLGLFRSSAFRSMALLGMLVNVVFYGLIFVMSLFFQQTQHLSALQTGLAFIPMTMAILAGNLTADRAVRQTSMRTVLTIGVVCMWAGSVALLGVGQRTPYFMMMVQMMFLGLGLGLIVPVMTSSLLAAVDKAQSGAASGVLNTARQLGSVIGVSLFGSFIARRLVLGLHVALAVSAALLVSTLVLTAKSRAKR